MCEAADTADPSVAEILRRSSSRQAIHFNASPEKLAWKMRHARMNDASVELVVLRNRHTGDAVAYAVLRSRHETRPFAGRYRDFRSMTVMDYGLAQATGSVAAALVAHLAERFFSSRTDVFQLISSDTTLTRAARRLGLVPAGKGMSFCCRLPESLPVRADWATGMDAWPVTHFSGDGPFL